MISIKRFPKWIYWDFGNSQTSILLAGSGRSGTTWVENILNHDNAHRIVFEPFHTEKNKLISHWEPYQYLRSDEEGEAYLLPAKRILDGKIRSPWVDRLNRKIFSKQRIIKEIRANLSLHWIRRNFPEVPIIFLLRHPCAVANSRLKLNWHSNLEIFLGQDQLVEDHLAPFLHELVDIRDPFESHIADWCIENYVPLKLLRPGEAFITYYEDILEKRDVEIQRMFNFLHREPIPIREKVWSRPSPLSREGSAVRLGRNPLLDWKNDVDSEQIKKAVEMLSLFGLDKLYDESPFPRLPADKVLSVI